MSDLGVMLAACHGPSLTEEHLRHALTLANDQRLHSIKPSEAYRRTEFLKRRPRWTCIVGSSLTDRRRGPKDNPILVSKRRAKVVESGAFKACRAAFPRRLAPERWVTWVLYQTDSGLLVLDINIHPNPSVQSARPTARRVRGHFQQMRKVERLVLRKRAEHGDDVHPVISGDVNSTADWAAKDSPASVFKRLGLASYWHGILAIAHDPRLVPLGVETIPASQNGQDHPWLIATFKQKR